MYVFKDKKVRNDVLRKGGNQMKIIVTPEEMRSNATNIRTEKANFESYNAQFTSFGELLESFAQKLDTAANTMEETDGGLAASMGQ